MHTCIIIVYGVIKIVIIIFIIIICSDLDMYTCSTKFLICFDAWSKLDQQWCATANT